MVRPTKDEIGLQIAKVWSLRSTCPLRNVGCLLVDKDFRTLSTGYNGVAKGAIHCIDYPCAAIDQYVIDRHKCEAIHAEANALIFCNDVSKIHTCYTTVAPCHYCIKLLLGTACERIVFLEDHPNIEARELWLNMGKEWIKHDPINI